MLSISRCELRNLVSKAIWGGGNLLFPDLPPEVFLGGKQGCRYHIVAAYTFQIPPPLTGPMGITGPGPSPGPDRPRLKGEFIFLRPGPGLSFFTMKHRGGWGGWVRWPRDMGRDVPPTPIPLSNYLNCNWFQVFLGDYLTIRVGRVPRRIPGIVDSEGCPEGNDAPLPGPPLEAFPGGNLK